MMQFEDYQWEDHVPRRGSWIFDLVIGALAFGLIAAALPEHPSGSELNFSASAKPAVSGKFSALDGQGQFKPAAFTGRRGEQVQCPAKYADS